MVFELSPVRSRHARAGALKNSEDDATAAESEIGALRAENAELRKVVIALSKLVIKNVLRNEAGS